MSTTISHFEAEKNRKAGLYTLLVIGSLLLICWFVRWSTPLIPPPLVEDGIEVNLGNSEEGLGDDQALSPEPASQTAAAPTPTPPSAPLEETPKEVETDDRETDAPVMKTDPSPKPKSSVVEPKPTPTTNKAQTPPVVAANPTPAKPKALFKGVSGNQPGGNEADDFRKGGNQGIAGGAGDQGKPGGNPNSTNYKGDGGNGSGGVAIRNGLEGRRISKYPSFEDDFNENAKIAVDIKVDAAGNVVQASFQARGSTTSDANMKAIALRKARQLKLSPGDAEAVGTILFNFKLKN